MTERPVDVDDELLAAAQRGTGKATIERAARQALERGVARRAGAEGRSRADWHALGDLLADLHDEDVVRQAWWSSAAGG